MLVSVPWRRGRRITREDAADDAEMDGMVEGARGEGPYQGPGTAARAYGQAGEGQAEDRHRWAVRRGQGRRGWVHADRGPRSGAGGGAVEGVPDLRGRRRGGSPARHEDEHVIPPTEHMVRREAGRIV